MATTDVQSLFLQVDASVELLRRNLAAGEQPLGQFEQRANKTAMSVEKSIETMGKNFGPFAQMAQSAAQQAEKSFEASFTQIQRMAATAITAPSVKGGGLNFGAAEARQAAEVARQQAVALGLVEQAARAAAAGEGVMTQETRLYLQAASAARIEAERHAAELTREAGAIERLEIETRSMAGAQQLLVNSHRDATGASAQARQSTMMLGQQVQDFAVQVVSGQSVLIAFSQQIGQAAFAVQGMEGRLGAAGAFLASGWGTAVLVATTVLVPLVGKMIDHNNALDDAVGKLKDEARETALADKAHAVFSNTLEGQIELQRRLNDELDRSIRTQRQDQQLTLFRARQTLQSNRDSLPGQREAISAQERVVAAARASAASNNGQGTGGLAGSMSGGELAREEMQLKALRETYDRTVKAVAAGERAVREAQIPLIQNDIETSLDRRTAATSRYTDAIYRLQRQLAIGAGNQGRLFLDEETGRQYGTRLTGIDEATYRREALRAATERDAALKAEEERRAAASRSAGDARRGALTPGRVGSLLTGEFGGTITSTTGGKHVPNSYHYRGQAVDFVPRGGMRATSKAEIRAFLESQGVNIKELLGPGDKDHNDHFHVAFSKSARSQDEIARRAEAAQNAILSDQISYAEQERQARRRLLDAQRKTAATEEERDRLAREEIEADYGAQKTKIDAQLARRDLKPEEASRLSQLNDETRAQRIDNIRVQRAIEKVAAGYDSAAQNADAQMAMLRIQGDMAVTQSERRRIALELLRLEQEQYERALMRTRDTSQDPYEVQRATDELARLPGRQEAERGAVEQRYSGPLDQYRDRLHSATDDMGTALEDIEVRGLENVQEGLAGLVTGTQTVGGAFKRMANDIIADLARIAVQKLILSALPGGSILGAFGLAGGGKVEGRASGGKVSGPGTGTSDSILAMLGAKPIMLSNGESIVTAEATAKFWPVIDAMNKGKVKQLAAGGLVSALPSMPTAPRLPAMSRFGGGGGALDQITVLVKKGEMFDVEVHRAASPLAQAAAIGGSEMAQQEIAERQMQALS